MPNPRLFPAHSGTPNEYEVIASGQIIGRNTFFSDRSKPWFWVIDLPFRGSRRHPWHGFEATRQAAMEAFDSGWHANRRELPSPDPGTGSTAMRGAQFEVSVDGVPAAIAISRRLALLAAQILKSGNPNSVVRLKDLKTGKEIVVAFKSGQQ